MYKSIFVPSVSRTVGISRRIYDTSLVADYCINECGHIRSDFAVLNERSDAVSMARLLQRVEEYSSVDVNKGKSLEQILMDIRPRMCETPAEMDRFEQYCIDHAIDFYNKLKESEVAKLASGAGERSGAGDSSSGDSGSTSE